ncbi:MAG: hypothetical protein JMN25_15765 [gamma proteobacterium endosymbiont of Lamellibrachia anaximandri]|nr:hypothetical protein [gamma proteobacterium endosymbiont of Lamellibrachia anaximandri]
MRIQYQKLVERLVRDDEDRLSPDDIDVAIDMAVTRYSKDRPNIKVQDVAAPGGQRLNLPDTWVPGFSDIQAIEYPIGELPVSELESWQIYLAPAGEEVLIADSIDAAAQVRFRFTVFHTLDTTSNTIPVADKEAVASYAAAACCDQLATFYSGDTDSTIQADSVEHGGKAREFSSRANKMRKRYYDELGIDPKRNQAAGVVVDLDMNNSLGRDRLLHPGRLR